MLPLTKAMRAHSHVSKFSAVVSLQIAPFIRARHCSLKLTQGPEKFNDHPLQNFTLIFKITNLIYTYLLTIKLAMKNEYTLTSDTNKTSKG